jgi:hypothetical protein
MKAFDLEAALAGEPVVTRDGRKATVTKLPITAPDGRVLISQRENGDIAAYHRADGTAGLRHYDLFMATTQKTFWVNLYHNTSGIGFMLKASRYETEGHADHNSISNRIGGKAHPIVIEE